MGIWYCSRTEVKSALDLKETARNNTQIDRAIEAASRRIEKLCHRQFYPQTATRYFDWPNRQRARAWRLWLDVDEIVSVTSATAGGVSLTVGDILLEPVNRGAPYNRIELNVGNSSVFAALSGTWQRAIAVTGVFGWPESTTSAGSLAAAISSTSATTITVSDSSHIGVGDTLKIDSEYLQVTESAFVTTSNTTSVLTSVQNGNQITGITTGTIFAGETLLIDAERMLVVDVTTGATDTLTVKRAWDGSTLAAHNAGATIYAPRSLTVSRGVSGTTAATHTNSTAVSRLEWPGEIKQLAIAYAIDQLQQEGTAYARTVGSGDNQRNATGSALKSLEADVYNNYGRKNRHRTV